MKITAKVNQSVAISRGYNAEETVKLDVDVSTLSESQRKVLGEYFTGGDFRKEHAQYPQHRHCDFWPEIPQPDVTGLLEKLDAMAAAAAKEQQESAARIAKIRADFDADPEKYVTRDNMGSRRGELSDEQRVTYDAIRSRLDSDRQTARDNENAARAAKEAAEKSAREAKANRLTLQLSVAALRFGGLLAERYVAGYGSRDEVIAAIQRSENESRGLSYTGDSDAWGKEDCDSYSDPLTDEQFLALKSFKSLLPDDATIRLVEMHDHAEDSDGDKDRSTKLNRILVAHASWPLGEISGQADAQIGTLPEVGRDESEA